MRLISQAGVVALLATQVFGHPSPSASQGNIRRRAVDLSAFRLKTEAEYSDAAKTLKSSILSDLDNLSYTQIATLFVQKSFPEAEFRLVPDYYIGKDGIGHVIFKQTVRGLDIDNADFNVNVGYNIFQLAIPTTY